MILDTNLLDLGEHRGRARLVLDSGRIAQILPRPPAADSRARATSAPAGQGGPSLAGSREPPCWTLPEDVWLLPGFTDGHTHLVGLGLSAQRPNLGDAVSRREALERLREWLRDHPGDAPVIGEGWDQSIWPDPRPPTRVELDQVAPGRAVALRRVCGHVAVLNSGALSLLGSEWADLDPESGYARESLPLSLSRLWPPTPAELRTAVEHGQSEALRHGVTGIQEMGHTNSFRAFERAEAAGRLRLRVTQFFGGDALESLLQVGLVPGAGSEWLRMGGLKIFLDGSIGGRSAAVREPYPGDQPEAERRGLLLKGDDAFEALLRRAGETGWPAAMHAIGDRAIEQAIAVVERIRAAGLPLPDPRLEHAEMMDGPLLDRAMASGFFLSMQPNFTARWQNRGALYESVLGWNRARRLNPYRSAAATGRLHFGSDTMPLDPLLGLRGAVGHPLPAERLSLAEAILHYTERPSGAVPRPYSAGRIQEGARADLVAWHIEGSAVWGPEIEGWPRAEEVLARTSVAATWVGGVLRFLDAGLTAPPWVPVET